MCVDDKEKKNKYTRKSYDCTWAAFIKFEAQVKLWCEKSKSARCFKGILWVKYNINEHMNREQYKTQHDVFVRISFDVCNLMRTIYEYRVLTKRFVSMVYTSNCQLVQKQVITLFFLRISINCKVYNPRLIIDAIFLEFVLTCKTEHRNPNFKINNMFDLH